jgi:hypothetical protein
LGFGLPLIGNHCIASRSYWIRWKTAQQLRDVFSPRFLSAGPWEIILPLFYAAVIPCRADQGERPDSSYHHIAIPLTTHHPLTFTLHFSAATSNSLLFSFRSRSNACPGAIFPSSAVCSEESLPKIVFNTTRFARTSGLLGSSESA